MRSNDVETEARGRFRGRKTGPFLVRFDTDFKNSRQKDNWAKASTGASFSTADSAYFGWGSAAVSNEIVKRVRWVKWVEWLSGTLSNIYGATNLVG